MIDLHCHILPGLDDGSPSIETSIEMARMAVADGITHMACTPHVVAGLYDNDSAGIAAAVAELTRCLAEEGIKLGLVIGADIHATPDLLSRLAARSAPTLAGGRYFLFEPPHHVLPPGLKQLALDAISAGFCPVLTHPERLTWIEHHYDVICDLDKAGVAIQLTAASIVGGFGSRARYWSERMLDEGRVDIIATDAHDTRHRPPLMSPAFDRIAKRLGEATAHRMTTGHPELIIANKDLPAKARSKNSQSDHTHSDFLTRWLRRRHTSRRAR